MTTTKLYWTYAMLRDKVLSDLDLQEEDFISPAEMLSYANEAIDKAEQYVHTLYEDYYLDFADIPLLSNVDEYDLPATVYAEKIRQVVFRNGSNIHKVKRMADLSKFMSYDLARFNNTSTSLYEYFLRNSVPGLPKIMFTPPPLFIGTCWVWFLRQANRLEVDGDVLDIPEGHSFVLSFMKMRCAEKESHGELTAGLQTANGNMEKEKQDMIDTLAARVPDGENNIEPDLSLYEEMS